jgi:hypothetical protein
VDMAELLDSSENLMFLSLSISVLR